MCKISACTLHDLAVLFSTVDTIEIMAKRKNGDGGKFPMKHIRPTAFDLAALEVVSQKQRMKEAQVWRTSLSHYVEFLGVRDQVEIQAQRIEDAR